MMKLGFTQKCVVIALASSAAYSAFGTTVWNEVTDGDFSDDGLAPTSVVMGMGANTIIGSTGNAGQGIDRGYFRFTVPDGAALTAIRVLDNTSVSGSSSFIGIQAGPQLTVSPSGAGAENLLGFAHYGNDQVGHDILPAMAINFAGALPSGTYSVWVQELGGPVSYGFDFVITAVPEPSVATLMVAGLLGLVAARRR